MKKLLAVMCLSVACFNPVQGSGGGGGGTGTGGSSGTGGSGTGGSSGGGSAGGGSAGGGSAGGGSSSAGGGSATGGGSAGGGFVDGGNVGDVCGGFGGINCASTNVCIWMDKSCGGADQTGTCQARPGGCGQVVDPVCGCNGQVYDNECLANAAGVDVAVFNSCTPPAGTFSCGYHFCQLSTSYCENVVGGVAGNPGQHTCTPYPAGCGSTPSCACLSGQMCGGMCSGSADAGLSVTCQVP
jgi:hypothetical protein